MYIILKSNEKCVNTLCRVNKERKAKLMKHKILIVEDDTDINNLLKKILQSEDYEVSQAFSGTEANSYFDKKIPDLLLLDLMLPGITGEELLHKIREDRQCDVPVLILSAKNALKDKVTLLGIGADDYITKPFEPEEVVARIRAALRRSFSRNNASILQENICSYKNIKLYPDLRKVTVQDKELFLTVREYEILHHLIQNPEKVYPRECLYELVWHDGYYGSDHTVNVHVSNLRKKIKEYDPLEEYIQSVYGVGFRLAKS